MAAPESRYGLEFEQTSVQKQTHLVSLHVLVPVSSTKVDIENVINRTAVGQLS